MSSYGPLIEEKMQAFLEEEYQKGTREMTTSEICKMIGKHTGEDSFLYWAYKNNVNVVVPGIMDGAVGSQIWLFAQKHSDFRIDMIGDANLLAGLVFKAEKSGAFMIGADCQSTTRCGGTSTGTDGLCILHNYCAGI